ncbi:MAG: transglutaminase N-terminal domain-containing protein [Cohaesibacteraceae bacterium]
MKRYELNASTTYTYGANAARGYHMVRMLPRVRPDQPVDAAELRIAPEPTQRGTQIDAFGNPVHWFLIDGPHDSLSVEIRAEVRSLRTPNLLTSSRTVAEVSNEADEANSLEASSPAHYLQPTTLTEVDADLAAFADELIDPEARVLDALEALSKALYERLTFDGTATDVSTLAADAFKKQAGVCQDFAHIMLAACRHCGLPACYVSGYIRTDPPPGQPRLAGADAMHAWVSVWTGMDGGWVEFDPTNGVRVVDDHIVVAIGRDYQDAAPMRGEVVGAGAQSHTVAVDLIERV